MKTYWWRVIIVMFGGGIVILGWLYENFFCFVDGEGECLLDQFRLTAFEPLFLLSLSLLVISPFLFFISDTIFKKWLKLTLMWFALAWLFILMAPEYSGSFGPSLNPTKESISIWMSILFILLSLGLMIREWWKVRADFKGDGSA